MMHERQNDAQALKLLKASTHCTRIERFFKSVSILLSLTVCFMGIFNHYSPFMNPIWLACLGGIVLIVDAIFFAFARYFGVWSASLMDMFDHHVYQIPSNKLITKNMSQHFIDKYSALVKDEDGTRFKNYYFEKKPCDKECPVFRNQKRQFEEEYRLLKFCRLPLYFIWLGFFGFLILITASWNYSFLDSIINIFVPSLGIIMLIVNSWISFEDNLRDLKRCNKNLEKKRAEYAKGKSPSTQNLNSPLFLRTVQDAVFKFRSQNITIPSSMVWLYDKTHESRAAKAAAEDAKIERAQNSRRRVPRKKKPVAKTKSTTTPKQAKPKRK